MKHLGTKIFLVILAGALFALEACLGLVTLRLGGLSPGPVTREQRVALKAGFFGIPSRAEIRVNGELLPPAIVWGHGAIEAGRPADLREGDNEVRIQLYSLLPLRSVEKTWTVRLDTRPPELTLSSPDILTEPSAQLTGQTEPGAALTVQVGGKQVQAVVDGTGAFAADVPLADGLNAVSLRAVDAAGNESKLDKTVVLDQHPPEASAVSPGPGAILGKNNGLLMVRAEDPDSGVDQVLVTLDGHPLERRPKSDANGALAYATGLMPEGKRDVVLTVKDKAGFVSEQKYWFLVDSTETLGLCTLTLGARGADVKQLQKKLVTRGLMAREEITGVYDQSTVDAINAFQQEQGLEPDGKAGPATLAELGPKIVVSLGDFTLELRENGRVLKSYSIAHGQPAYPTPTGEFHVADMVMNPTWLPPDSAWAREAQPIAPGPNNPLGTRWIGLNSGLVGIHGTNDDGSIGSRASHGCIRMHIEDVEDLYGRIQMGTPVSIR